MPSSVQSFRETRCKQCCSSILHRSVSLTAAFGCRISNKTTNVARSLMFAGWFSMMIAGRPPGRPARTGAGDMRAGFLFGPRHRLVATYAGYCQTAFLSCAFGAVGYWSGLHGVGLVSLVVALFLNGAEGDSQSLRRCPFTAPRLRAYCRCNHGQQDKFDTVVRGTEVIKTNMQLYD
jgi:hypothetical protein